VNKTRPKATINGERANFRSFASDSFETVVSSDFVIFSFSMIASPVVVLVFEQDRRMYDFRLLITERDFFRLKHFMA